ncbi:peptide deformylase [Facilibium subflavum]
MAAIQNLLSAFKAHIIQHEIDHLNGILFPSRLNDLAII